MLPMSTPVGTVLATATGNLVNTATVGLLDRLGM